MSSTNETRQRFLEWRGHKISILQGRDVTVNDDISGDYAPIADVITACEELGLQEMKTAIEEWKSEHDATGSLKRPRANIKSATSSSSSSPTPRGKRKTQRSSSSTPQPHSGAHTTSPDQRASAQAPDKGKGPIKGPSGSSRSAQLSGSSHPAGSSHHSTTVFNFDTWLDNQKAEVDKLTPAESKKLLDRRSSHATKR